MFVEAVASQRSRGRTTPEGSRLAVCVCVGAGADLAAALGRGGLTSAVGGLCSGGLITQLGSQYVNGMTEVRHPRGNMNRWTLVFCTVGLVALAEALITVEWSTPFCHDPYDGPSYAAYGFPFPYDRFSGASSSLFNVAPHILLLDILLLSAAVWPLIRHIAGRAIKRAPGVTSASLVALALLLPGSAIAWHVIMRDWHPVISITRPLYDTYDEFRPVGIATERHYDCTPSTFWFSP